MICDQDPPRRRPGVIDGEVKTTGGVCLNGGKSGQMAFRRRANLQNQAIGWLPKGCRSLGGGTVELKLHAAVTIQPQNPCFPFTPRVSHINTPNPPITL